MEENTINALSKLKKDGYHIIGIEQVNKSLKPNNYTFSKKTNCNCYGK